MCLQFPQFTRFPTELQREIFLLFKDDRMVHRYAHVAKRTHVWLEPYVYRTVWLIDEGKARAFLDVVTEGSPEGPRALHVKSLTLGRSVSVPSIIDVLTLCRDVKYLNIKKSLRYLTSSVANPLLEPFNNLLQIRALYTELATVSGEDAVPVTEFLCFTRPSHLHFHLSWPTLYSVPVGFSNLPNLTHLSMFWDTGRQCNSELVKYLKEKRTAILVLWVNDYVLEKAIHKDLLRRNLNSRRVVVFRTGLMSDYMAAGGFWKYAVSVVEYRKKNKVKSFEYPIALARPHFFRDYRRFFLV